MPRSLLRGIPLTDFLHNQYLKALLLPFKLHSAAKGCGANPITQYIRYRPGNLDHPARCIGFQLGCSIHRVADGCVIHAL